MYICHEQILSSISKLQTNLFKIDLPKTGQTYTGQVVKPRHQTLQGQQVTKYETPMHTILSGKVNMIQGNKFNPVFSKKVAFSKKGRGQGHPWPHFYQTRSAWSVDQGSNKNHSPAFAPTVTKFCVMWEGLSLPPDTKFGNCSCKIVDSRSFPSWSLIHGLRWSGLIKVGPGRYVIAGIIANTLRY